MTKSKSTESRKARVIVYSEIGLENERILQVTYGGTYLHTFLEEVAQLTAKDNYNKPNILYLRFGLTHEECEIAHELCELYDGESVESLKQNSKYKELLDKLRKASPNWQESEAKRREKGLEKLIGDKK